MILEPAQFSVQTLTVQTDCLTDMTLFSGPVTSRALGTPVPLNQLGGLWERRKLPARLAEIEFGAF